MKFKQKDEIQLPHLFALALQMDGWYLRQTVVWAKKNCMPESCTDRCTKSHEYVFLLTKSARYFWDAEAIAEPGVDPESLKGYQRSCSTDHLESSDDKGYDGHRTRMGIKALKTSGNTYPRRNRRSVWTIATSPFKGAHFATFPPKLVAPCILAGTSARGACPKCGMPWERETSVAYENWADGNNNGKRKGDIPDERMTFASGKRCEKRTTTTGWRPTCTCGESSTVPCKVLDPFGGSGTTGQVALELGRHATLIELNPEYVKLAWKRCHVTPGLQLA